MIHNEQIAHDLAIAYVLNRHGAEVRGEFSVDTFGHNVTGSGEVSTERLPDVDKIGMVRTGTGQRGLFGLFEKTELVESGEYEVDGVFINMIADYNSAYSRLLALLESR